MIEWKEIEGYEGYYEVNNTGEIRSVERMIIDVNGKQYHRKSQVLRKQISKDGYYKVVLNKDGKSKTFLLHRLVAQAFIPNPDKLPQINHKDENRLNNNIENLEWCDPKYNCNYGTHKQKLSELFKNYPLYSKPVLQYLNGELIKEWESMMECERHGFDHSAIRRCCLNEQKQHKGYNWRFKYAA